jgi:hypothetical protein
VLMPLLNLMTAWQPVEILVQISSSNPSHYNC